MKASYFTTPRRMDDATFHAWADPIERDPSASGSHASDFVVALMAVAFIAWAVLS